MCGRYTIAMTWEELRNLLGAPLFGDLVDLPASYNVAPTHLVPTLLREGEGYVVRMMRWGVAPEWSEALVINAKGEKYVAPGRSYWAMFERCAIPASGFYEWRKEARGKQPMHIRDREGKPLLFAGLYQRSEGDGGPGEQCVIVTTSPNAVVAPIHNRMPAILLPPNAGRWLDPDVGRRDLVDAIEPYPPDRLEAFPVSRRVNDASASGPDLVDRIEVPAEQPQRQEEPPRRRGERGGEQDHHRGAESPGKS